MSWDILHNLLALHQMVGQLKLELKIWHFKAKVLVINQTHPFPQVKVFNILSTGPTPKVSFKAIPTRVL